MRIVILHSAIASDAALDEQETLMQVTAVKQVLLSLGHEVFAFAFTLDLSEFKNQIENFKPDVVFNLVESVEGKSEYIHLPALFLQQLGIPFTGGNSDNIFLTTDKLLTKKWLLAANLPTPHWLLNDRTEITEAYIIKSVKEDGSLGIDNDSIVSSICAFNAVIQKKKKSFGGDWFAEKFISGREFNISLLIERGSIQVLPIAEIQFNDYPSEYAVVNYDAKWQENSVYYKSTVRSFDFNPEDAKLLKTIAELSKCCAEWFNLKGYARIDWRVNEHGEPFILEVNVNPSIAPDAGFVAAAEKAGISYKELINSLVSQAFK